MRFVLARTVAPAVEPVTLAELIQNVREFSSLPQVAQDQLTALIVAGREWVEDYTGRALVEQQWALHLDSRLGNPAWQWPIPAPNPANGYGWYTGDTVNSPTGWLLRKSPVIAITEFVSIASDGTETEIAAADYRLADEATKWPRILPINSWAGEVFRITYRAGYAPAVGSPDPTSDTDLVPQRYKQAIMLHAEAHYDRDERTMQMLLDAATNLVKPERCELSIA